MSSIPKQPVEKLYVSSEKVVYVNSDETVSEASSKMLDGGFTQLPVFDRDNKQWLGIVTDFTLLRRLLSPTTKTPENWLNEFKNMTIEDAKVIDSVPIYPVNAPISEIAQALLFHYAVLINETRQGEDVDDRGKVKPQNLGIVTRADYLKLLNP